jgi:hypothetical protein
MKTAFYFVCLYVWMCAYAPLYFPDSQTDFIQILTQHDRLCGLVVQSSWLQIRRPGFDSRHYQKINVVGLERGTLNLVSTNSGATW